jgi:RHS repeat-associated protein
MPGAAGAIEYLHTDALGSVRVTTDGDWGNTQSRYDYLPFGEEIPRTVNGRDAFDGYRAHFNSRHRFTGKERDDESSLDYFGARYYSGPQGRFTSADAPFADQSPDDPQSWNLYTYGRNNPMRFTDPTGRCVVDGEQHGWLWCAGHALGLTETKKEAERRVAAEIASKRQWLAANNIRLTDRQTGKAVDAATLTNEQVREIYERSQLNDPNRGLPPLAAGPAAGTSRRAPEFKGGETTESGFLRAAEEYLGPGYREVTPGSGRYVSADGMRQVRLGAHEVRGAQLHAHFEAFDSPGGRIVENTVVRVVPNSVGGTLP